MVIREKKVWSRLGIMGGPDGCKSTRNKVRDPRLQGRQDQRLVDAAAESVFSRLISQSVSDGVELSRRQRR